MAHIIFGKDQMFGAWAAARIPSVGTIDNFGKFVAAGVATGQTANDRLLAVCVFHEFYPRWGHCQVSMASADPRWVSKQTVKALLSVPFLQYRCHTVRVTIAHTSERTLRLVKRLGFKPEATLKDYFGRGSHAIICRMGYGYYERAYWKTEEAKAA